MTVLRWTEPASADFLGIVEWITMTNSPTVAAKVGRRILDAVEGLMNFPGLGRPGRSPDTRELAVTQLPYLVIYSIEPGAVASDPPRVVILRVLHGSMHWPRSDDDRDL